MIGPALMEKDGQRYSVVIRKKITGEERSYTESYLKWHEASMYYWTDGNGACGSNLEGCFE